MAARGRVAAPVFRDFMMAALNDRPALPFRIPPGVQLVEVDYNTGCLPGPESTLIITEAFKPDTGPTDRCEDGTGREGYRVDRSTAGAGDETVGSQQPAATPTPYGPSS